MALVGLFASSSATAASRGCELTRRRPDARARPALLPRLLRARARSPGWCCRTALQIPLAIVFVARLPASTSGRRCAAAARCRRPRRSAPLIFDRSRGDEPPTRRARRSSSLVGLGAMVGGAHLFVEELLHDRRDDRRRAARALAGPRAAGDRAAGEGQQLLLGPRGQGQPGARQHHRGDGLPVDDPGRLRPRSSPTGTSTASRSSRRRSASPAASLAYWALRLRGALRGCSRSRSGPRCSAPSSPTSSLA